MKISVVMCTYNGTKYVERQVESILNQTHSVDEIIVCDDGSSDDTIAKVEAILKETEIEYEIYVNNSNQGVAKNFLTGLKKSTGDYVFTCDQDDVWVEDKVEIFLNEITKTHKMLYFSNGILVDAEENDLGALLWDTLSFKHSMSDKSTLFDLLLNRCIVTGAAMVVSRKLIDSVDCIPNGWLHDGWLAMYAAVNDSIYAINKETFLYRQHANNVVGAQKQSFWGRIKSYLDNIAFMESEREKRKNRYIAVLSICPPEKEVILKDCISFWSELDSLRGVKFMRGMKIILFNYFKGNYKKFYTGMRGAFRDILSLCK